MRSEREQGPRRIRAHNKFPRAWAGLGQSGRLCLSRGPAEHPEHRPPGITEFMRGSQHRTRVRFVINRRKTSSDRAFIAHP